MAKKIGKLARRYAKAFLSVVQSDLGKEGSPSPAQDIAAKLNVFARAWETDEQLPLYFLNPMFDAETRADTMRKVAREAGLPEIAANFLRVLVERDRAGLLPEVGRALAELADEAAGVVQVRVSTAQPVEQAEREDIERQIAAALSGSPQFAWEVEPELMGGMLIQYAGRVFDGSLRGRLARIERGLTSH